MTRTIHPVLEIGSRTSTITVSNQFLDLADRGPIVTTAAGTWRNLRSIMFLTLHVAAMAALIRFLNGQATRPASFLELVVVVIASLISWTIARVIFAELGTTQNDFDRTCPGCRRPELRPLVKAGQGIFEPVSSYRCGGCWTTIRIVGDLKVIEPHVTTIHPPNSSGICFLDVASTESDIRFLDDPPR